VSSDSIGTVFLRPEARARHLEPHLLLEHVRRDVPLTINAGRAAVDDFSMAVARGELVALVGPPGSGKSTLVALIAALDRPTSGRIVLGSDEISSLSEERAARFRVRSIGIVRGDPSLLEELTVLENVMLPMLIAGGARRTARQRADALLELFGIATHRDDSPSTLTSDERQRVALARALANDPQLVVADEPTARLDAGAAARFVELLQRINAEGTTVLYATADQSLAHIAPRRLHILDGRLVRDDESLRASP
jgi:putative ABC transport system ATP-binding protein